MTASRKLEEIASNLDDMSVTLEEIQNDATCETEKLDKVQTDMERAADMIEESLTHDPPEQ